MSFSERTSPSGIDWSGLGVDVVIESSGKFKTAPDLETHLERGARAVVVACPV